MHHFDFKTIKSDNVYDIIGYSLWLLVKISNFTVNVFFKNFLNTLGTIILFCKFITWLFVLKIGNFSWSANVEAMCLSYNIQLCTQCNNKVKGYKIIRI